MEKVRAKFRCNSIEDFGDCLRANFTAIYGSEGENADYAKATPSGELHITIDLNTPAFSNTFFFPKKDYYIDFIKA